MSNVQFLAPLGLLALIGIPLVIFFHMRHTTPLERPVPTLRFWRMVAPAPTDDARLRRPPMTLLLLLQLLAVGALGLALARPAVADAWAGLTQRTEPKHLVILLDGSTSMAAIDTDTGENRFSEARRLASERVGELRDGDVATVMLLGTSVQSFEATDGAGLRALETRVKEFPLPGGRADLNSALGLTSNLMLPELDNQVVVITDGAVAADRSVVANVHAPIELLTVGRASAANLAVVQLTARASSDNANETELFARLANFSDQQANATVTVFANDIQVDADSVPIAPNTTVDFMSHRLPAGVSRVRIELDATIADALPADNVAELVLARDSDLAQRILLVSNTPLVLQRALTSLPGAHVTTISTIEHLNGDIPPGPYDLSVFEGYTPINAEEIDTPVFFVAPPVDGLLPAVGVMTTVSVQHVRTGDSLLDGVDLTGLTGGETPIHQVNEDDTAVVEGEGGPILYRGVVPGTNDPMVVLTLDLQESALPQRIAFPILTANVVRALAPAALPDSAALGDPVTIEPRAGAATVRIVSPSGVPTDIPVSVDASGSAETVIFPATGEAGEYAVQELDTSGSVGASGSFVVNAGHPVESNLRANDELPDALAQAGATDGAGATRDRLGDLWPALSAFAIGLLAFEWLWMNAIGARRTTRPLKGARA